MTISRERRFIKKRPCPICAGWDDVPRGKGMRCGGYIGSDGDYAHCSRPELAGGIDEEKGGTFAHRLRGPCKCGTTHGEDMRAASAAPRAKEPEKKLEACYAYTDEAGELLYEVVRFRPKTFRQRHLAGGAWVWNLEGVRRVLYRLHEVVQDDSDRTVYIPEGEKDVDALTERGYLATCNSGGAGKWGTVANLAREVLAGRDVVVIADNDDVGRKHAREIEASLGHYVRSIKLKECPPPHKDVSDLLAAKLGLEALLEIAPGVPLVDRELVDPEAPPPAPTIAILRWPEIAMPMPEPSYLVKELGMVDGGGSPHIIAGYGFSGKTLALQSLALSLVTARPIWAAFQCRDARRVVHVDLEQGDRLTRRRYQRLAIGMNIGEGEIGDRLELVVLPQIRLVKKDRDAWLRLMTDRSLIIVDSLRAASPGVDENSSAIREPLDMLLSLSEATGCRGALVVHARKPGEKDGPNGAKFSIRGSSAIFDASDGAYVFAGQKGEPVTVSCERVRSHGDPCEDFAIAIQDVAVGEDLRAGVKVEVRGAELVRQKREEAAKVQRDVRGRLDAETMRKVLGAHPGLGARELRAAMRRAGIGSQQRIDDALAHLGTEVDYREEVRGRTRVTTHCLRP